MAGRQSETSRLRAELEQLKQMLGIGTQVEPGEHFPDYIEHGSPEHVTFVGLKVVTEGDDTTGFTLYTSKESGVTYRLEDEIGILTHFPGVDPDKAALLALRQKVNEVESGVPPIPERAPSLWQPVDQYTVPIAGGRP